MTQSQELLCVMYLSLPERFSVMSMEKMPEKSEVSPTLPSIMNTAILPRLLYCKGEDSLSLVQEIDLALSLVFYYVCVCVCVCLHIYARNIYSPFQMPYSPEFDGSVRIGTIVNCDLIFPDLGKRVCIFSVLI